MLVMPRFDESQIIRPFHEYYICIRCIENVKRPLVYTNGLYANRKTLYSKSFSEIDNINFKTLF